MFLTAGLRGQITLVGQLIDQRHQLARRLPRGHSVSNEPSHRGQHTVDPPSPTHRLDARTSQHLPTGHHLETAGLRSRVAQPGDEQAQRRHAVMPMPAGANKPAQKQRDRAAYDRVVNSEPSRPNRICRKNASASATTVRSSSSTVQYLAPDGNLTGNARTPISSRSRLLYHYQPRAPQPGRSVAEPGRVAGLRNITQQVS